VYVCSCRAVTDRTIAAAITSGADSVDEIGRRCGAGTRCGGCWPVLDELLELLEQLGGPDVEAQPAA
jgi:bacterioferritin-associated ferredoxin